MCAQPISFPSLLSGCLVCTLRSMCHSILVLARQVCFHSRSIFLLQCLVFFQSLRPLTPTVADSTLCYAMLCYAMLSTLCHAGLCFTIRSYVVWNRSFGMQCCCKQCCVIVGYVTANLHQACVQSISYPLFFFRVPCLHAVVYASFYLCVCAPDLFQSGLSAVVFGS